MGLSPVLSGCHPGRFGLEKGFSPCRKAKRMLRVVAPGVVQSIYFPCGLRKIFVWVKKLHRCYNVYNETAEHML